MNTKEAIWREALRQFSDRGYHGVTMKEIAAGVGINDSSIYNHYKSKEEIFNTIIEICSEWIDKCGNGIFKEFIGDGNEKGLLAPIIRLCQKFLDLFLENETAVQFRRLLVIERSSSPMVQEAFQKIFLDNILDKTQMYFEGLIQRGYLKNVDPSLLALQFYAPMALLFLQTADWKVMGKESLRKKTIQHVEEFDWMYRKEQRDGG